MIQKYEFMGPYWAASPCLNDEYLNSLTNMSTLYYRKEKMKEIVKTFQELNKEVDTNTIKAEIILTEDELTYILLKHGKDIKIVWKNSN